MRRIAKTVFACLTALLPLEAAALCGGPGIEDILTEAQHDTIAAKVARTPCGTGLIWDARRGDDHLTIVGTVHIPDPRLDAIVTRVNDDLNDSTLLLVEATPEDLVTLQNALMTTPNLAWRTDGPTLPELLDEESWQRVREAAADLGLPAPMAAKMQPWMLSLSLAMPPCAMQEMAAGQTGLDGIMIDIAQGADIPVEAVEPWKTLITLMAGDPIEEQLRFLKLSLSGRDLNQRAVVTLLDSYFDERTAYGWKASLMMAYHTPGLPHDEIPALMEEIEQDMLITRNHAWIPVIEDAMTRHDRVTLAVGAGHLPGKDGVLNLLSDQGWIITRQRN